ncbi:unnamed protein product [Vicia faba]|uniref:Uncharacterized protein n=1 Tax=Vicia faba TaxID=3906 RepID=A0AAV0Z3I8_VICFA|nr:unnamed protein product [Vicia faba]
MSHNNYLPHFLSSMTHNTLYNEYKDSTSGVSFKFWNWKCTTTNYAPYRIDFPGGPTGRFSNGKTSVDVITEKLGFNGHISLYASARGRDILRGVNYASTAAGIREETGQQLGKRISFRGQVVNYQRTMSQLVNNFGDENTTANYLSKCIYTIGLGSNDYLNNYFMPQIYSSSRQFTPQQYANVILQAYAQQLKILYNYGARKMALFGVGQIGCSPSELAQNNPDGRTCVARINSANQLFNNGLKSLVDQFNNQFPDARFIYVNVYGIFGDIINNPSAYGFRVTNAGCYGVGRENLTRIVYEEKRKLRLGKGKNKIVTEFLISHNSPNIIVTEISN